MSVRVTGRAQRALEPNAVGWRAEAVELDEDPHASGAIAAGRRLGRVKWVTAQPDRRQAGDVVRVVFAFAD